MQDLRPLLTILVGALVAYVTAASSFVCNDDADCSFNGACNRTLSTCNCRPAWKGADCGVLNLLPAPRNSGLRLQGYKGFSNGWGGSPIRLHGGRRSSKRGGGLNSTPSSTNHYALIAAAFENNCSLSDWTTNSVVIRAVSTNGPLGPFNESGFDVVVGAFAHNPEATPIGDADGNDGYALFFIGTNETKTSKAKSCYSDHGQHPLQLEKQQQQEQQLLTELPPGVVCDFGPPMCIRRASSSDSRSWREVPGVALEGNLLGWDKDVTNPGPRQGYDFTTMISVGAKSVTPLPPPTKPLPRAQLTSLSPSPTPSAFFMAYRSTEPLVGEQLGMATAPQWNHSTGFKRTNSSTKRSILPLTLGEDPTIWQDTQGHWHMLMHQFRVMGSKCKAAGGGNSPYGLHAFSKDGVSAWRTSQSSAFNCVIEEELHQSTGSGGELPQPHLAVHRRERPKVLLSAGNYGDPTVLYTGVQLLDGRSFTHAQPVATSYNSSTMTFHFDL